MKKNRRYRLYSIIGILLGVSVATLLLLYALRQNVDLYYTPNQVLTQHIPAGQEFRLGGIVAKHSVHYVPHTLKVTFAITNEHRSIRVRFQGLLPSLFREGQGIVAQGKLMRTGVFVADQVLAKHDATYKPPGVHS